MTILVACAVVGFVLIVVVFAAVSGGPGSYGGSPADRAPLPPWRKPQLPTDAEADALRDGLVADRVRRAEEEARLLDPETEDERRRRLKRARRGR